MRLSGEMEDDLFSLLFTDSVIIASIVESVIYRDRNYNSVLGGAFLFQETKDAILHRPSQLHTPTFFFRISRGQVPERDPKPM